MNSPRSPQNTPGIRIEEPLPPPLIPDHELFRCIGRGSYGDVWLARNVMGTYRAVKVVHRRSFQDDRPFEREFAGLQRFEPVSRSHDSQVDILHIGRSDDWFYYVMELADDEITGAKIDPERYRPKTLYGAHEGHLQYTADETLEIGLALTTALEHLHKHGLVHRDIKPTNVIFVNGIPKLADIGLVTSVDATRSFVGTEGFVPPEGPGAPTGDLYSLGKVLYELCTGRDRKDYPELPTSLAEAPDRERLLELNAIIAKACRANPQDRYQSAEAMEHDLLLMQSGKSVRRMQKLEQRLVQIKKLGIAATIILLVSLGAFVFQRHQTTEAKRLADENFRLAEESLRHADESQRNAQENIDNVVRLLVSNGNRMVDEGRHAESLPWFVEALKRVEGDSERAKMHRIRLNSVIGEMPRIARILRHDAGVTWCEFSPDGTRIATASKDRSARIWEVTSGIPVTPPLQHEEAVQRVRFSPDGRLVATASGNSAWLWDAETGRALSPPLTNEGGLRSIEFAPHDGVILTTCEGGPARLWNTETGIRIGADLGHGTSVTAACFTKDGEGVLTGDTNGVVTLWDIDTWKPRFAPIRMRGAVTAVAFSPDGTRFVVGVKEGRNGYLRIWDTAEGTPLTEDLRQGNEVIRVAFSPDGRRVLTSALDDDNNEDGTRSWDAATGALVAKNESAAHRMGATVYSADGLLAAVSDEAGYAQVMDAETLRPLWPRLFHGSWVHHCTFSPDGQRLATSAEDGLTRVWELANPGGLSDIAGDDDDLLNDVLFDALFSPDGELVLRVSLNSARLLRVDDGSQHGATMNHPDGPISTNQLGFNRPQSAQFRPDGSKLLLAPFRARGTVVSVWSTAATELLIRIDHNAPVYRASFSSNGRYIVTAGADNSAVVWDAETGMPAGPRLEHAGVTFAAFSSDDNKVATAGADHHAKVWDWRTGEPLVPPLQHDDEVHLAVFSPDDTVIVTAGRDQQVRIWDAKSGRLANPPIWHGGRVYGAAFGPDEKSLISWGLAPFVAIWNIESGDRRTPPLFHRRGIYHAEFSSDGRLVVSASRDRTARLWDAITGEPISVPLQHGGDLSRAAFHPSEPRVLTADDLIRIWNYEPLDWSFEDIQALTWMLCPEEIDSLLVPRPIENDRMMQAQHAIRTRQPDYFTSPSLEQHRARALDADARRLWRLSIWHLGFLIRQNQDYHGPRGKAYANAGLWEQARADFQRQLNLNVETSPEDLLLATLMAGDRVAARRIAGNFLNWLARDENADAREQAAVYYLCSASGLLEDYGLV
ncbi:MAG TPA: serine/threonine-protein kinase, partial [Methylomirabilota bacterium]|nr:serine/threonine-protein kinase [Methylomirabilota bacterium]